MLGGVAPGSDDALERIGFVAQDTPLYPYLSVRGHPATGGQPSPGAGTRPDARARLAALDIPLDRKVGKLSGGQHSQVALAVALARRPELLILDEPVARLDPVARYDFMAALMSAVAETGSRCCSPRTSSRSWSGCATTWSCSAQGRVQVAGDVDDLIGAHRVLTGPTAQADAVADGLQVVRDHRSARAATLLARVDDAAVPQGWHSAAATLEEIVLGYLRTPTATSLPGPHTGGPSVMERSA